MEMEVSSFPRHDGEYSGEDSCFLCGKPITGKRRFWIHLLTTYRLTTESKHPQSQGLFPIGPSCKRKIPNQFIHIGD